MSYILVKGEAYETDTEEGVARARRVLAAEGLDSAPIFAGAPDCPDSYQLQGCFLFATESRHRRGLKGECIDAIIENLELVTKNFDRVDNAIGNLKEIADSSIKLIDLLDERLKTLENYASLLGEHIDWKD